MSLDHKLYEKIANLVIAGLPESQIGETCGIDVSRVSQIKQHEVYKEIVNRLSDEEIEVGSLFDKGWDRLEQDALGVLITAFDYNKDPDFALKVAVVANKAVRRNGIGRGVIPMNAGAHVVINLNQRFVDKLQAGVPAHQSDMSDKNKKRNDTLTVKGVQDLLAPVEETELVDSAFDAVYEMVEVG